MLVSFSGGLSLHRSRTFKALEGQCPAEGTAKLRQGAQVGRILGFFEGGPSVVSWSENSRSVGADEGQGLWAMGRSVDFILRPVITP